MPKVYTNLQVFLITFYDTQAINESIVKYKPEYEELINDWGQTLANHDKLGTKEKIGADMDKLKMQWEQLCDSVTLLGLRFDMFVTLQY